MNSASRILLTEDNAADAVLIQDLLSEVRPPLQVEWVARLSSTLDRLDRRRLPPVDAVLLDLSLPDSEGLDTFRSAFAFSPETPFVVLTGLDDQDVALEAVRSGAQDYLIKGEVSVPVLGRSIRYAVERKRVETSLRESEARYRAMFEENRAVKLLFDPETGAIVDANSAAADFYGYSVEQLCAMSVSSINVVPDDAVGTAMRGASTEQLENFAFRHRLASGEVRDVEVSSGPIREHGRTLLFSIVQDVTARKLARTALERSTELLSHGESLAHLGSWEWDIASGSCAVSKEWQRIHGLVGDNLSNDEITQTCHEDDRAKVDAAFERAVGGGAFRVDHRIVRPDTHEVRYLMTYGEPSCDAEDHFSTVIGASLDVTERVHADEVLHEREERLRSALGDTVAALGATVAMRDPYTSSHERRVAELACLIAERRDWSEEAVERLRMAALVHDVGKIAVPAEILSKPTRLSQMEFDLIKGHSQAAYEILAAIEFGGPVAEIVYQHHERLDGSGYPRGLSGDEILPGACVLAVADVVEAMITHRPYRAALPLETALSEIEGGAGSRYDADACAAAVRLFREEGFTFSKQE